MSEKTTELTNLHPNIVKLQDDIRNNYKVANQKAKKGQILFIGSSLMEIFPIETLQKKLNLDKAIYNRGIRATTTADLLNYIDILIFELAPSKIFINIGSNDIGFSVPEENFLANYDKILHQIKERLPKAQVYVMAYYPINTDDDFGEDLHEHAQLYEHRSNSLLLSANDKIEQLAKKWLRIC